jgi:TraY domain
MKPGPKPRGPFKDKRRTITTRITEEIRAKLEAACAASGRSLSQEIELRLEIAFAIEAERVRIGLMQAYADESLMARIAKMSPEERAILLIKGAQFSQAPSP